MAVYQGVVKGNVVVLPENAHVPDGTTVEVRVAEPQQAEATSEEQEILFQQHLVEIGLMTEVRKPGSRAPSSDFTPIKVSGKPLSEMVIEERR